MFGFYSPEKRRKRTCEDVKVLAKLIWDLQSFLSVLDSENLSYIAQAQKKSVSELLSKLQSQDSPVEDAEYMIMSCPSSSPSNDPLDTPATGVSSSELLPLQDSSLWKRNGNPTVPPLPSGGLGGDQEDTYEEAEPYMAASPTMHNNEKAESDSSHYESYGEEEEDEDADVKDRAHYIQWSSSQPCLRPAPESRLCGYLWRRKWLGQWSKQLFIVRNDVLLSGSVQEDSEDQRDPECPTRMDEGFLNVLMNCQWQNLRCQVEGGFLYMFGEEEQKEEERGKSERCPQYTVQLRGCEVRDGPDHAFRVTLSMLGDQVAVLEVSSAEEKQRWLKLLQDASYHDNTIQEHTGDALSRLQTRKFPTSNPYMDDPFAVSGTCQDQPLYSNTSMLEHMLHGSQDSNQRASVLSRDPVTYSNTVFRSHNSRGAEVQRSVQKLELAGKAAVQLRAGSETNLPSVGKQSKRASFRQSLALYTERAQASILNPLLRRTASAKNSLRRAPSALFLEHGKVFQRKKEWETKAAA